ncbi:hypothetical protein HKD37_18G051033 [Glycine soja]
MQMADRGRGGGRRTFISGRRRGLSLGAPITTNPSTSSIHISTSESMIHVIAPTPNTLPTAQEQTKSYLSTSWLKVSVDLRDRWFGEFKKEYRWHPQEERAIRAIFETKALDEHWGSTDFLNKSSTAKANQSVDRGASTYYGGSISIATHFEKLSKEFQRPSTTWEVIEKTKKLKSGEWVNDKS